MNEYDVKRLALIFALQAEIEGMHFSNLMAEQYNDAHEYSDQAFFKKAEELRLIASKHNEQL